MSTYAGPAEGVMLRRQLRADKAAEDVLRDAQKRKRANEDDVARGGELGVGDPRAGASASGPSGVTASRAASARAGRSGTAGALPIAKARLPLAPVDPNEDRDPIGARGDGAVGARGAPARRARAKDQGDDRRALLLRATFERWREAGAAAKRERVAVRERRPKQSTRPHRGARRWRGWRAWCTSPTSSRKG